MKTVGASLLLVIEAEDAAEALARLDRYELLRGRHNLPRMRQSVIGSAIHVEFFEVPTAPDYDRLEAAEACGALVWLAAVEAEWGASLAAIGAEDLRYDDVRRSFSAGPGLFRQRADGPCAVSKLLTALGASNPVPPTSVQSALALLAVERPELAVLLEGDTGARVRALRDNATAARDGGDLNGAIRLLSSAWRLRPGDAQVGVEWVEAVASAGADQTEARVVAHDLAARHPRDPRVALALAHLAFARDDHAEAEGRARVAVAHAPHDPGGWRVLARLARARGDHQDLLRNLVGLAVTGDERALASAVQLGGLGAVGAVLDGWIHPWTPVPGWLRIAWLYQEDRLRELLQFFFDVGTELGAPSDDGLARVLNAAERLPGRLQAVRERLRGQLMARGPEPALLGAYLDACDRDGVPGAVQEAAELWPHAVPNDVVARACHAVADWPGVLSRTEGPELASLRFTALARNSLATGAPADPNDLNRTVQRLLGQSDGAETIERELAALRRVSPNSTILRQIESVRRTTR